MAVSQTKAHFVEPLLLLRTDKLPEGTHWAYELKLDSYRAIAFKSGGRVHLRSRNDKDFNGRYTPGRRHQRRTAPQARNPVPRQ